MTRTGIALALLLLAGCSGDGDKPATPKELAGEIGCASTYSATSTDELGVEAVGTCTVSGSEVRLLTFASDEARDTFVEVAKSFGGRYVTGPGYAIEAQSADVETAVQAKL